MNPSKTFYLILFIIFVPAIFFISDYRQVLNTRLNGEESKVIVRDKIYYLRDVPCANTRRSKCSQSAYHLQVSLLEKPQDLFMIEVSWLGYTFVKKQQEITIIHTGYLNNPRLKMLIGNPEEEMFVFMIGVVLAFLFLINMKGNYIKKRER